MGESIPDYFLKPGPNYPEKIILVLDTITEPNCSFFTTKDGDKVSVFEMTKKAVEIFLHHKSAISKEISDNQHQFTLVTLGAESMTWLSDFTSNIEKIKSSLCQIKEQQMEKYQESFNLQSVFREIYKKTFAELYEAEDTIYHVVLIYCRSHAIPKFDLTENKVCDLTENPNFFIDVLYVHEPSTVESKSKEIFKKLKKLNLRGQSYIFEVGRNAVRLFDLMSEFLSHPLQRAPFEEKKKLENYSDVNAFHTVFQDLLKKLSSCKE